MYETSCSHKELTGQSCCNIVRLCALSWFAFIGRGKDLQTAVGQVHLASAERRVPCSSGSCRRCRLSFSCLLSESEILAICLALARPKKLKKTAVIKSAASVASAKGGCASSRLDHGFKFYVIQGGCASSQLISGFSDCVVLNLNVLCVNECCQTVSCCISSTQGVDGHSRFCVFWLVLLAI